MLHTKRNDKHFGLMQLNTIAFELMLITTVSSGLIYKPYNLCSIIEFHLNDLLRKFVIITHNIVGTFTQIKSSTLDWPQQYEGFSMMFLLSMISM